MMRLNIIYVGESEELDFDPEDARYWKEEIQDYLCSKIRRELLSFLNNAVYDVNVMKGSEVVYANFSVRDDDLDSPLVDEFIENLEAWYYEFTKKVERSIDDWLYFERNSYFPQGFYTIDNAEDMFYLNATVWFDGNGSDHFEYAFEID